MHLRIRVFKFGIADMRVNSFEARPTPKQTLELHGFAAGQVLHGIREHNISAPLSTAGDPRLKFETMRCVLRNSNQIRWNASGPLDYEVASQNDENELSDLFPAVSRADLFSQSLLKH
jgi:hypothetical protein